MINLWFIIYVHAQCTIFVSENACSNQKEKKSELCLKAPSTSCTVQVIEAFEVWKIEIDRNTHSRFAITPAVRVEPLLPPHPTSITLSQSR